MLKALLKKQFLELNAFYFQDKKTGKARSKRSTVLYILLFALLFLVLCGVFCYVALGFAPLLETEMSWLYFSLMGMLAIFFGTFGSVFTTYAGLYHARDNEMLLSMPIPPSKILLVRMLGVAAIGQLYEAMLMLPALGVRFLSAPVSPAGVVCSIVLVFVLNGFVTVLSCLLGWVVALLSSKFKNKSLLTVLFALIFLAAYYYFFSQSYQILQSLYAHSQEVGTAIRTWLYPVYLMGLGAEGNLPAMLGFTAGVLLLLGITWFILSKTFLRIATKRENSAKAVYQERKIKAAGLEQALFRKELRRYLNSPTYILNCSLGTVFMLALAVISLIYAGKIQPFLPLFGEWRELFPVAAAVAVSTIASMNYLTAPSVSLEGRNLWILQSLPVPTAKVFDAKQRLHWVLTMPPALVLTVCLAVVLRLEPAEGVLAALFVLVFILFSSAGGLALNLKLPNLEWTNETAPIKQSMCVMIALFGGWLAMILFAAAGFFLAPRLGALLFLLLGTLLLALGTWVLNRWLRRSGARIFETL